MRISGIKVEDFARIESCDLSITGAGLFPIYGQNKQGKTTLLTAIKCATQGKKYAPKDPIRHGADDGEITLDLEQIDGSESKIEIRRRFLSTGSSPLKVTRDGMKGDQGFLDSISGELRDPLDFISLPENKQTEKIFGMVDLGSFNLAENKAYIADAEQKRRDLGRDVKRLEGSIATAESEIGEFDPETAISMDSVMDEIQEANRKKDAADTAERALNECYDEYNSAKNVSELAAREADRLRKELSDLQSAIDCTLAEKADADADMEEAATRGHSLKSDHAKALEAVPDMDTIQAKRREASANDAKRSQLAQLEATKAEFGKVSAAWGKENKAIDALRKSAKAALSSAKWPVEGMGYDPAQECLMLDGSRWDQASDGEKFTAAVQIAIAQPSVLRVLWIKNGSLLDAERLAELDRLMIENDYQAFIELVGPPSGTVGAVAADGKIESLTVPAEEAN